MVQTATTSTQNKSQDSAQGSQQQPHTEAPGQAHTGTSTSHAPPVPFPKDCKACKGAQHMLDTFKHMSLRNKQEQLNGSAKANAASQHPPRTALHQQQPQQGGGEQAASSPYGVYGLQCPPDTAELGRASWVFLHSMAAHYPEEPSRAQQTLMRNMIDAVAEFYPCSFCRAHFQSEVDPNPPDTSSNSSLSLWLCSMHNKASVLRGVKDVVIL
uniref:Sulfhydryl oxidase n=1 Tax=Dunaliella tertiolecta TaxID=3047 RepID=A0A7S3VQ34_DUNTE